MTHQDTSVPRGNRAVPWRAFYDDYDNGTMFISRGGDPDDIFVDRLPGEVATTLVDAHNAALRAERLAVVEEIRERLDGLSLYGCDEVSHGDFDTILGIP